MDALYNINGAEGYTAKQLREEVYLDLKAKRDQISSMQKAGVADKKTDNILKYLFNFNDFDYRDLNYRLSKVDEDTRNLILSIFDENGDDYINSAELRDDDLYSDLQSAFGLNSSTADIIGQAGKWKDPGKLLDLTMGAGVDKNAFAKNTVVDMESIFSGPSSIMSRFEGKDGEISFRSAYKGDKTGVAKGIPTSASILSLQEDVSGQISDTFTAMTEAWSDRDREWFNSKIQQFKWHHPYNFTERGIVRYEKKRVWKQTSASGGFWVTEDVPIYGDIEVKVPAVDYNLVQNTFNLKVEDLVGEDGKVDLDRLKKAKTDLDTLFDPYNRLLQPFQ